jgi:hypothetical protein
LEPRIEISVPPLVGPEFGEILDIVGDEAGV